MSVAGCKITSVPQRRFLRSKSKGAIPKHSSVAHRSAIENTLSFFSACLAASAFSRYERVAGHPTLDTIESRYRLVAATAATAREQVARQAAHTIFD
jgi:hypothetical protein